MYAYWDYGWSGGWWWMALMMVVFWGGVVWISVTAIRHTGRSGPPHESVSTPTGPARPTPREILAERLARGEIEPDDYRRRLDALDHRPNSQP